ncbi:MAG: glycerophosphodiester phosphodiesterase family protein, partial [Caulobacteraceae bacterium]
MAATELTGSGSGSRAGALAQPVRRLSPKVEVFAHRGFCALRPEHTLAAYALAIAAGADYVEPDLVMTKDGVLIIRHENNVGGTTDVAAHPEFADRKTTKIIDGETVTGWFTEDFTLAELKTLRAVERIPDVRAANTAYNGHFQLVTFEEMIDFVAAESVARRRVIGMVPELKHSTYFSKIGLPMEDRFLRVLAAHDYTRHNPVEIQSFEIANLKYLRAKLGRPSNVRLMQLASVGATRPADVAAAGSKLTADEMLRPDG